MFPKGPGRLHCRRRTDESDLCVRKSGTSRQPPSPCPQISGIGASNYDRTSYRKPAIPAPSRKRRPRSEALRSVPPDPGYYAPSPATPTTIRETLRHDVPGKRAALDAMVEELHIKQVRRHILLCSDQTKPKCCPKALGLKSWDFLKARLAELGLVDAGGVYRSKVKLPAGVRAWPDRGRLSRRGPGTTRARPRCWSASSRST